jgi:hypothetical protein
MEVINGKLQLIPERADIIKEIFRLSANGYGKRLITKRFSTQQVLFFTRGNGWRESYITAILRNRAVIGEFHPHLKEKGKRIPSDIIVKHYFPRAISDAEYNLTQLKIKQRIQGGGRPIELAPNKIFLQDYCIAVIVAPL